MICRSQRWAAAEAQKTMRQPRLRMIIIAEVAEALQPQEARRTARRITRIRSENIDGICAVFKRDGVEVRR